MKLTYDPRYNTAYIELRGDATEVETIQVGEDIALDLAPDGTVVGIEFLNANDQLRVDLRRNLRLDQYPSTTPVRR